MCSEDMVPQGLGPILAAALEVVILTFQIYKEIQGTESWSNLPSRTQPEDVPAGQSPGQEGS